MYCGTVWNICAIWHNSRIANRHIAADTSVLTNFCTSTNDTVCINERIIFHDRITMDFCTCVQQHTIAHDCAILNTGILQNDTPITKFGVGANVGTGCNDIRESIAHCRSFLIYLHPEVVITNSNHEQTITLAQLRQICNLTNNRSTTNLCPNRLSIVHKSAVILEHRLLGHHASKTTSTNQQELFLRHWEYPSTRSAHTQ